MSDADPEAVTVSAEGITVRKTVDTEQFQTLAVVVELASERDDVARVQLVDPIPSDVPMDDVGFHPNYGSEHWSVEDGTVAFERDFEPGETYTTVYGLRDYPEDETDALLVEPEVGLVETGPESLEDVVDEERSEVVRDFVAGEADLPGLEEELADAAEAGAAAAEAAETVADAAGGEPEAEPEPAAADEAEPATPDAGTEPERPEEPAGPEEAPASAGASASGEAEPAGSEAAGEPEPADAGSAEPAGEPEAPEAEEPAGAPAEGEGGEPSVPVTGGVVRVLVKELREGDVDPDDRRMLRDELLGTEGTTEARIGHLQQRVSDLEAYADALEEFIDEEGTAEAILAELRDDVAGLGREVRAVEDRLDEAFEELGGLDDRLDAVDDDVDAVESRQDLLEEDVETVEDEVAAVDGRVDDLGARIDRVATDVDEVEGQVRQLDDQMDEVDGDVAEVRDELAALRRDLRTDIQALEDDLADFEAFRERLSSVFGGAESLSGDEDDQQ
ncbi:MAG: hypothetical protein ABEJ92_05950 [Halobacteriales archaeon]